MTLCGRSSRPRRAGRCGWRTTSACSTPRGSRCAPGRRRTRAGSRRRRSPPRPPAPKCRSSDRSEGTGMRYAIVLLALLLAAAPPAAAQPQWPADDTLPVGQDWIQIESGEWLKGKLLAMYDDDLELDSDEFGVKTFDWKDVKQVRTARTMTVGLTGGEAVVGKLVLAGETVRIFGDERREVRRSQVLSISPSGSKPFSRLGGKVSAGLTARKGNVDQLDT